MANKESVVILTAYGRGHWLAKELASNAYKTTLVDFTENLGNRSPEVWESPFGVFTTDALSSSQKAWLSGTSLTSVKSGFTFLFSNGPVELQGPLRAFYQKQFDISGSVARVTELKSSKMPVNFMENWPAFFAMNIASTRFQHNAESLSLAGKPLPIIEDWALRTTTRRSFDSELESLSDRGCKVYSKESLTSIEISNEQWNSLQVGNHKIAADRLIVFLSSEELAYLNKDSVKLILGRDPIPAEWFWAKFRFLCKGNWVTQVLPKALCITEPDSPWTHENCLILHRGTTADEFYFWARLPNNRRFDPDYLKKMGERIRKIFLERFPTVPITEVELPKEFGSSPIAMGPPTFPVFPSGLMLSEKTLARNAVWWGPELWERLDWEAVLRVHTHILNDIQSAQLKKEQLRRRGRDSEIYW